MKAKTPKSKPKFEWTDPPARPLPRDISFVLEDILVELRTMRELDEHKYKEFLEYKSKKQGNNPNIRPYSSLFSEQNKKSGKEYEKEKI